MYSDKEILLNASKLFAKEVLGTDIKLNLNAITLSVIKQQLKEYAKIKC